ncbi:uncharacterized protein LOC115889043 [Sitophilus oryzae]|uniref:Uncharacterized protein LOC115889043 n=1 Tax=Sitophilus oryzae TaxID=7048 RepID=A0A6J2YPW4_SITOR|nr:uncharacterized protein LOC115889043 [Sitophilus oryzae]
MKVFLIISCFAVGVLQIKAAPLNEEQKEKLASYHKHCLAESKVDEALVKEAKKGQISEDPAFKIYLNCFSQKIGFQDAKGVIQKDVFEQKIGKIVDDATLLEKIVNQCAVQQDNPVETSFYIEKCLHQVAPNIEIFKVNPDVVYVPNEKAQEAYIIHKDCALQFNHDEQEIDERRKKGTLFDNNKYRDYFFCFSKRQGFQNEDGQINRDGLINNVNQVVEDKAVIDRIVEKCNVQQDTAENTAFFLSKCLQENLPVYVELFPRDIPVPDEEAKQIIKNGRECLQETGVNRELVQKTRNGIFVEDPTLKEFAFCMGKKAGFINEAGDVQIDVLRKNTLKLIKDPVVVEKLVKLCGVKKETPQETSFYASKCFSKNSPGRLSITQFGALSSAQQAKASKLIKECFQESSVPNELVLKARKGNFSDDPLLKQYFLCVSTKAGVLSEAGEFNNDVIINDLTEIFNADEANSLVKKCAVKRGSPTETAFESFRCFYQNAPEVVPLF